MALDTVKDNLTVGSTMPTGDDDTTLTLFGHQFCPYTHRVRLVFARKEIEYNPVWVDLMEKADWVENLNLRNKVPVLYSKTSPHPLFESLIIAQYLDDAHTESGPRLCPTVPYDVARDSIAVERLNNHASAAMASLLRGRLDTDIMADVEKFCRLLSEELTMRETKFLASQFVPGYADYMIWPLLERIPALVAATKAKKRFAETGEEENGNTAEDFNYLQRKFGRVAAYAARMAEDETVASLAVPNETHYDFFMNATEMMPKTAFDP